MRDDSRDNALYVVEVMAEIIVRAESQDAARQWVEANDEWTKDFRVPESVSVYAVEIVSSVADLPPGGADSLPWGERHPTTPDATCAELLAERTDKDAVEERCRHTLELF